MQHLGQEAPDSWRAILCQQYAWHEANHWPAAPPGPLTTVVPRIHTLADIYKCLYQGEFGIGHSIDSAAMFRELLERELQRASGGLDEPLWEQVAPDGAILRLNLRPYRQLFPTELGRAVELLVDVCLASAAQVQGEPSRFLAALAAFQEANAQGELVAAGRVFVFPPALVTAFLQQVQDFWTQQGGLPVLSHSAVYRRYNRPSYRVVSRTVLQQSPLGALLLARH